MTKQKTITCYRWVQDDMTSEHNKKTLWKINEWNKCEGEIEPCSNGFHACRKPFQSMSNIFGNRWFLAEARGVIVKKDDKFAASEMRLIKELPDIIWKRFALWNAKQCLKNYEKEYPDDNRISECIRITELYLDGKVTLKELSAAWSAASAASAAKSAASAAWSAAWSAASAAWSAAESAQEKYLNKLVREYLRSIKK